MYRIFDQFTEDERRAGLALLKAEHKREDFPLHGLVRVEGYLLHSQLRNANLLCPLGACNFAKHFGGWPTEGLGARSGRRGEMSYPTPQRMAAFAAKVNPNKHLISLTDGEVACYLAWLDEARSFVAALSEGTITTWEQLADAMGVGA